MYVVEGLKWGGGGMKSKEMKEGTYLIMHETGIIQEEIKSSYTRVDI